MSDKSAWTPYGLEAIRIGHLRRRRLLGALFALGLALAWLIMFQSTTSSDLSISVNGKDASSISLDIPEEEPKDRPVTVALQPGRVTRADTTTNGEPTSVVQRTAAPTFDRAAPLNWNYYVLLYGPYVLLGLALLLLARRRGKHDEVNYGVYKGSMPLEMISASAAREVFTTRHARASVFGKRRSDHLPPEMAGVERHEPRPEDA